MAKASKNGLHRRHYDKHKERIKPIKAKANRERARRIDPTWGLTKLKRAVARNEVSIEKLIDECRRALAEVNARCDGRKRKSANSKRRVQLRDTDD